MIFEKETAGIESVRVLVNDMLLTMESSVKKQEATIHL
ncbi:hypothetical protein EV207_12131 [Scopulibacillus darangshiensis]|uniref:Uncharacterized protein n=1 Tax=Scopulibacillus darangshiensis TaxID=442528 RepID=A0A4R2NVI0_9BACL|nr:hypothetical protein EV207_12131 [Scopulibacillus darangshiensis]